jgi:aspartyl-tRNA(Asn)/glutamyl-tRNA(Gln) amidotransferase subunit C
MIDEKTVKHIAKLARIRLDELEVASYSTELSKIMGLIEELESVPSDASEIVASVVLHSLPLRADVVSDGFMAEQVVANAPKSSYGCFVVPKVIDQG